MSGVPVITSALTQALKYADSYSRIEILLLHFDGSPGWYRALGENWGVCDNIGVYRTSVADALTHASDAHRLAMMNDAEAAARDALPAMLTVWRGAYEINAAGLSWSLSRDVAASFPFLHRYDRRRHGDQPMLLTGRVSRDRVVVKLDRGEVEIIAPRVRVRDRQTLEAPL